MIQKLTYKNFTANILYSTEDYLYYGLVNDIKDTVSFHGESQSELESSFREAIEDYQELLSNT